MAIEPFRWGTCPPSPWLISNLVCECMWCMWNCSPKQVVKIEKESANISADVLRLQEQARVYIDSTNRNGDDTSLTQSQMTNGLKNEQLGSSKMLLARDFGLSGCSPWRQEEQAQRSPLEEALQEKFVPWFWQESVDFQLMNQSHHISPKFEVKVFSSQIQVLVFSHLVTFPNVFVAQGKHLLGKPLAIVLGRSCRKPYKVSGRNCWMPMKRWRPSNRRLGWFAVGLKPNDEDSSSGGFLMLRRQNFLHQKPFDSDSGGRLFQIVATHADVYDYIYIIWLYIYIYYILYNYISIIHIYNIYICIYIYVITMHDLCIHV